MLRRMCFAGLLALLLLIASFALAEELELPAEVESERFEDAVAETPYELESEEAEPLSGAYAEPDVDLAIRLSGIRIDASRFPDASFRAYVQKNCDQDGDGLLTKAERMVVQEMDVSGLNIVSLKGLECFRQLRVLRCENNALTSLDVSHNFDLRELYCGGNLNSVDAGGMQREGLSALDLSKNLELTTLNCSNNRLSKLDVSHNTKLLTLDCSQNALSTLDLQKNKRLTRLKCEQNPISVLDLSACERLLPFVEGRMPVSGGTGVVSFTENGDANSTVVVSLPSGCFVTADGSTIFGFNAAMIVNQGKTINIGYTEKYNLLKEELRPFAQEFTYKSSNTKIATVDENGVVTGVYIGNVNITVTGKDGVPVVQKITVMWGSDYVKLSASAATLGVGETFEFDASLMSDTTASGSMYVANSDPNVCAVKWTDKHFTVEALQPGTATLTVSSYNKKKTDFVATVVPAPESVRFSQDELTLGVNETFTLTPVFAPQGASSQKREYSSSDTAVVTVDRNGKLTAKGQGQATVEMRTYNHLIATAHVTVKAEPAKVTLNTTSRTLGVEETFRLVPTLPEGSASSFAFSSDAKSVADVTADGFVTAVKEGTAKITVKTYNGKSATCAITVKKKPTSIKLEQETAVLGVGQVYSPKVTLSSGAASGISWTSSDADIVKTDEGQPTATGVGSCVLTASTYNGLKATCAVTVKAAPDAVVLPETEITISEYMTYQLEPAITAQGYDECLDTRTYASSDSGVVSVSAAGLLKGLKKGKATVTVTVWNGLTATCSVEVVSYHSMHPTKVIAHRGVSGHLPENTLAAFEAAPEYGAYGVELDVRTTKDGLQVINHDESIKVNGKSYVLLNYTYEELKKLKPDMCTLEEALEVIKAAGLELHMELKETANAAECVALVAKHGMKERTIYFTFFDDQLKGIYAADPEAILGQSINTNLSDSEAKNKMTNLHLTFLASNYKKTTQANINAWHNMGMKVCVWTVNDADNIKKFSEMGADYIITNYPDLAK